MKKLIIAIALSLAACEGSRHGEPCVGVLDQKNPKVKYEISTRNAVMGILFSGGIIVPAVVILKELECPVECPIEQPAPGPVGGTKG